SIPAVEQNPAELLPLPAVAPVSPLQAGIEASGKAVAAPISLPNLLGVSSNTTPPTAVPPAAAKRPTKELTQATQEARKKEADARQAEEAAQSISSRAEMLAKSIEFERSLLATALAKVDNADETLRSLSLEFEQQFAGGGGPDLLRDLRQKIV